MAEQERHISALPAVSYTLQFPLLFLGSLCDSYDIIVIQKNESRDEIDGFVCDAAAAFNIALLADRKYVSTKNISSGISLGDSQHHTDWECGLQSLIATKKCMYTGPAAGCVPRWEMAKDQAA